MRRLGIGFHHMWRQLLVRAVLSKQLLFSGPRVLQASPDCLVLGIGNRLCLLGFLGSAAFRE